jgi:hypothetical protein
VWWCETSEKETLLVDSTSGNRSSTSLANGYS